MRLARSTRVFTVLFALWALLFAQLALAGYACPGAAKSAAMAAMAETGMPCAQTMSAAMDEEQPALCHAHCQAAQPSADTYQPPALATFAQLGAVLTVPTGSGGTGAAAAPPGYTFPPDPWPNLAIRHCCFRI